LTNKQFGELFGPSADQYAAVMAFAQSHGLTVTRTHENRVLLDINGSVGDIEKAFNITLRVFQHPTENRTFFAPNGEPAVDESVPILDISGLDDYSRPHPLVHKKPKSSGPQPQYGSGPGGTYFSSDFRAAYARNVTVTGAGEAIGLLEFDGYYASDITSYESQAGLPNVPLTNVLLDGFNGNPGSGNIEVALDIEMAIAMAPGLSQVLVYEAGPRGLPNDMLNRMATDNLARQLSSSWAWSGGPNATTDQIFQQFAAQGQSFFQAAGDNGAYTGSIIEPCDNPYVTIVGGTTLSTTGPGGAWVSEIAWNWYNSGTGTSGTGGGISTSYPIPIWQQGISMSANQGSTSMRNIPDVALTADNIWVTYNNGSSGAVGGTSAAAPLWAGVAALINQQGLANGLQPIGFINPAIYAIGKGGTYASAFHDITTGNNTNSSSPTRFFAVSGFDLCTGWGTPAGSGLINALAGGATPHVVTNSASLALESCTNNAVDPNEAVTVNFSLVNAGSANTTNLVATLQAGGGVTSPGPSQTYGALIAGGSAVARPFSFIANGSCGGLITATLQLQDGTASLGTLSFNMPLGSTVIGSTFSEKFDGTTAPSLPSAWTTAVISGLDSSWVLTNGFSDTSPNSAFVPDAATAGETVLVSPGIAISSASAQLTFRHNYDLAVQTIAHPRSTTYFNGGVLEIAIGNGTYTDIIAAGGSFVTGGYNCTLATGNPLAGSQAWGGNSGGWISSTVNLPSSAAGQTIHLRWSCATAINASVGIGWFVDSVSIRDSTYQCCTPTADVTVTQTVSPNPGIAGQNLTYTLAIANSGSLVATNVAITNVLPVSVTFVSASPGCINLGGSIACTLGTLPGLAKSNILITVTPNVQGAITNVAAVSSSTSDSNPANNSSTNVTSIYTSPAVTAQPTNVVTLIGGNASFHLTATGSAPLSYRWTYNGSMIAGATLDTLSLSNVQPAQAGNYAGVVTNMAGSVTSAVATLTVLVPPTITTQPTNQTKVLGSAAVFQVGAAGTTPLGYQWWFAGNPLSGATTNALVLNNVQSTQAGGYSVVVTNIAGSVTSLVASLTVLVPPTITLQPSNQTTIVGQNVAVEATATGSMPLSYQWWFNGAPLATATSTVLNLSNVQTNQAGNYTFSASNAAGSVTSLVAQLIVLVPPTISAQSADLKVVAGSTANFQVTASGTQPLGYQWWFNRTNAVGMSTNVLTVTNVQAGQAGSYAVVVTNVAGSVTSSVVTLAIGSAPIITQQPSSLVVTQSQNATFLLSVSGDTPLIYEWRFNATPISGGNSNSYTVLGATLANAGNYDAVVTNAYGSVTSAVAQLTVLAPLSILNITHAQTVTSVSFQSAVGQNYQLQYKTLLSDPTWTTATSRTPGTGGVLVLQDTNAVATTRFYRVAAE
jgi:uncharacterized repeat protein (TIGR01451 family)